MTRDVTAWAWLRVSLSGVRCRGGSCDPATFWYRTDSSATCSRAWARLGPLSRGNAFDRGPSTDGIVATVSAATAHPTGWHGGIPTGRPWDFALGTLEPWKGTPPKGHASKGTVVPAKGLGASAANRGCDPSLPDPIPRIWCDVRRPLPAGCVVLGPSPRVSEGFPFAVRGATCGDSNPDCQQPFYRPLVSGGHGGFR